MERNPDVEAFVEAYERAWASREPGVMATMWHDDGRLHHPSLGTTVSAAVVPYNNDFTKNAFPEFSWTLERWASAEDVVFLQWRINALVVDEPMEWRGVDVMTLRDGKIIEEHVFFDTYPLRRKRDPALPDDPLVDRAILGPN